MLSFEHKKTIFRSYEELKEKEMSNNRFSYEYPQSQQRGKTLATQLNASGNGYVIGKYMDQKTIETKGYKLDSRGWINIKDFSETELREVIEEAMSSMGKPKSIVRKKSLTHVIVEKYNPKAVKQLPEDLVHSCLYNWLGYGKMNAPLWFIGMEEEGTEIWKYPMKTVEESLKLRSQFELGMDFRYVWEEVYGVPLDTLKGEPVWHYIAAFLLEFAEAEVSPENIEEFIFQQKLLGREDGDHFLSVFRPLPKKEKDSIDPYQLIWGNMAAYEEEITDRRFSLLKEQLASHEEVKLLISYDLSVTEKLIAYFSDNAQKISSWQLEEEAFTLYKVKVSPERFVYFLVTPFFANGKISYKGIRDGVKRVKRIWQWAL